MTVDQVIGTDLSPIQPQWWVDPDQVREYADPASKDTSKRQGENHRRVALFPQLIVSKFEVDDADQTWTFPEDHFDLVHTRIMNGSLRNWELFFQQSFKYVNSFHSPVPFYYWLGPLEN